MKFTSQRYRTSDVLREAFDWQVDESSPVYAKLSRSKLKASPATPSDEAYINHSGTHFISEAKDNYRPQSASGPQRSTTRSRERPSSLDEGRVTSPEKSTLLSEILAVSPPPSETEHISIVDEKVPPKKKSEKSKASCKPPKKSEEPMTRFLSDSAFTRKFNRPLFANFGQGATELTQTGLKSHNAFSKPRARQVLIARPKSALASAKKSSTPTQIPSVESDHENDKREKSNDGHHWEATQPILIAVRPSSAHPQKETLSTASFLPSNARGQSDLFRQPKDNRQNDFGEHRVRDSYFSHRIFG